MAMNRNYKAHLIIHSFATAAATWSAGTALIPIAGPLLADTTGLTLITIGMTYSLVGLFGRTIDEGSLFSFGSVIIGFVFGTTILKCATSIFPIVSSAINATITFGLHETIGWGIYCILNDGKDPTKLSKSEIKSYINKGKIKAKEEKELYENIMKNIPNNVREQIERLQKKLADENLSKSQKQDIMDEIQKTIERYN